MSERVLITGLGVVSCLGSDLEAYWSGLLAAQSDPAPVPDPHAKMDNRLLYGVPDGAVTPAGPAGLAGRARLGRTSRFALQATRSALHDAGLGDRPEAAGPGTVGIAIGTGVGDASLFEDARVGHPAPAGPDAYPFKVCSVLADEFGLTGPMLSVSTACSASAYSVSLAAEAIQQGEADVVVTGGADGYTRVGVACFNRMGGLDPQRCRPFSADRQGTVFGEGAAVLVLESESHARARGRRRWYGVVEGAGWSCDAFHPTAPEPRGTQVVRAMRAALAAAELAPPQVGCVVPHGTGTPLNDAVESTALAEVFGESAAALGVYSLKALLGHTGGAAGAFALLTAALIADRRTAPPNAPVPSPDPKCPLSLHTGAPLCRDFGHLLVNAYAFGGNNISVVVGQCQDGRGG
jgi:3-oxoacyl-(acyl-carrier-protein) synthase